MSRIERLANKFIENRYPKALLNRRQTPLRQAYVAGYCEAIGESAMVAKHNGAGCEGIDRAWNETANEIATEILALAGKGDRHE